jgi:hypothetical protein
MSNAEPKPVYMVEGEVVRGSRATWIGPLIFGLLIALGGLGLLLSGVSVTLVDRRVTPC